MYIVMHHGHARICWGRVETRVDRLYPNTSEGRYPFVKLMTQNPFALVRGDARNRKKLKNWMFGRATSRKIRPKTVRITGFAAREQLLRPNCRHSVFIFCAQSIPKSSRVESWCNGNKTFGLSWFLVGKVRAELAADSKLPSDLVVSALPKVFHVTFPETLHTKLIVGAKARSMGKKNKKKRFLTQNRINFSSSKQQVSTRARGFRTTKERFASFFFQGTTRNTSPT